MAIQQRCRNPKLRLHKATGRGRVILSGQHFYTRAAHDTPEAHEEYLGLLRRWNANGRRPLLELLFPADVLNPKTVRDLVSAYEAHLDSIKKFRKNGSPTPIEVSFRLRYGIWPRLTGGLRSTASESPN